METDGLVWDLGSSKLLRVKEFKGNTLVGELKAAYSLLSILHFLKMISFYALFLS